LQKDKLYVKLAYFEFEWTRV